MTHDGFDLVVIGGGSAGFAAAIRGAEAGARVALVEGGTIGGTCVNVGCVPSKTLIRAAEAQHRRTHHGFAGIPHGGGAANWPAIRRHKDELVAALRQTKYVDVLDSYPAVTLFRSRATLTPSRTVRLEDGRALTGHKIVVATGASPWAAPIPGLAAAGYLDSTSAMAQDRLPASMIVVGGSAVGLELTQMFARLGVRTSLLEALPRIVPAEDPAVSDALAEYLSAEGIAIHAGVSVLEVRRNGGYSVTFDPGSRARTIEAEQLLVATGRRASTRRLGLEETGVTLDRHGAILVDEYLQTSNPDIYAAGDVTGDPMFVYVAARAGAVAAENALRGNTRGLDLEALPHVTFTDPAVASVAMTGSGTADTGSVTATLPLAQVPRAIAARDTRGFIKLVADARTRRITAAHILAAEAGEMIMEPALAIRSGLTIDDLTASIHPYLTLAEGLRLAAQAFDRDVTRLSCCAS